MSSSRLSGSSDAVSVWARYEFLFQDCGPKGTPSEASGKSRGGQ